MKTTSNPRVRPGVTALACMLLVAALAGCGGGSTTAAAATPVATPSSAPTGPRGNVDPALQQKIAQCLEAAGISVPVPTGRPSGAPFGTRPTDAPTGTRPTGTRPSGAPGGRFADPATRAALQACGITLPTRPTAGATAPSTTG